MAAIGRAASKKGEAKQHNLGDEGFYEDDGAGDNVDYYMRQFQKESRRSGIQITGAASEREAKKKAEEEEYEKKKKAGLLGVSKVGFDDAEEQRNKAKRAAEKIRLQEMEETAAALEAAKAEKLRLKKYRKSSEFKKKQWEEKCEERIKLEADMEAKEAEHESKVEEYKKEKVRFERQAKIDASWEPKEEKKEAKPKPAPKGKKGKGAPAKAPSFDPAMYGGTLPPALQKKLDEQKKAEGGAKAEPEEKELPWSEADGDRDPKRTTKKEEKVAFEKQTKAWKKYLEEWGKTRSEYLKEKKRMEEAGLYDEPDLCTSSDSDASDSDDDDSDSDF